MLSAERTLVGRMKSFERSQRVVLPLPGRRSGIIKYLKLSLGVSVNSYEEFLLSID